MSNTERTNERFDLGEGIARQELNVIFVIDNSGSMQGDALSEVKSFIGSFSVHFLYSFI